nr:amidohydrolase family protein [uncultured Cupriavidus sp.]
MHIDRRSFLTTLAAAFASVPSLGGAKTLCPDDPTISDLTAPLTIDVHAHIFNGRDLQVRKFLSKTLVKQGSELYPLVDVMGAVLQTVGWHLAPSASREKNALETYAARLKECKGSEQLKTVTSQAFDVGYQLGKRELEGAVNRVSQSPQAAAVLGPAPGDAIGLAAAVSALPATYQEFEETRSDSLHVLGSNPTVLGYLRFVLNNFNYRHVNAIDYLTTYSRNSSRKIDLLVASMVDYDWWLAQGRHTPTTMEEQIDLMGQISVLLGGRVHGFVPFCPFRETMTKRKDGFGDSMRLVRRAVETQGFIGVKLYPPMGFAPLGNRGKTVWKGTPGLLPAAYAPAFGDRLDASMRSLFKYCCDNDVPVMAHSNHSNGPNDALMDLAGSEYWALALKEFPTLRVSFGHFGDTDTELHRGDRSLKFLELMSATKGAAGINAYADSGYFAGVLLNQPKMAEIMQKLYAASQDHVLRERLMYGTDWTMILPQKNVDRYLADFIELMGRIEAEETGVVVRQTTLTNAFFGKNAVDFLGLMPGMPTRMRLENFYADNHVSTPDWTRKVG